jgi:D-sedoheptulose 7-phosphate isomerase
MTRDWKTILAEHREVVAALAAQSATLDAMAGAIITALRGGKRLYILGNGGSAADAQHIAGELLGRFRLERRALPVLALTTDTSCLTAIANDLGYDRVFARQVEALVSAGDLVWAISTSGNSPNVLAAVEVAIQRGATIIGFTGATGGKLAERCAHVLRVPHQASDRIQEGHELAYHYICERVEAAFAENSE